MENDENKSQRGLRDISHFFLSSVPVKEQSLSHARPVLAVCVDPCSDCAVEMNALLAKNLELSVRQIDFHVVPASADFHENRFSPALFCAPVVFEELISDREGKVCLTDIPWNSPEIIDALIPLTSAVLVTVRPSISSLKNAFRFLKGAACFLKEDPFVRWEPAGNPDLAQIAFEWMDIVKHFLNQDILWINTLEPMKERIRNASSAVSAGQEPPAGVALLQEEALRRERQRSLHFQRDFLTSSSSGTASEPSPPQSPFYERARLSQKELEAFLPLAGQFSPA